MTRIAIHGFGRIGRATLRAVLRERNFTPVAVSDIKDLATLAALFAVDTNYGGWPEAVPADEAAFRKGLMDVLEDERPSTRIIGDPHGSLVDLPLV
jgi:glyceraldehyde 3-phosphate dehydrogenase